MSDNTPKKPQLTRLPIKSSLALIYALSFLIAVLMAVVSIAGLSYRTIIYPTEDLVRAFVPNDAVNLMIGLPILLGCIVLAWRGKWIGLLCWPGALVFVLYNYIAYLFAMPPSWAFLVHLALVTLSTYTLVGLLTRIDGRVVKERLAGSVRERFAGGVLAGLGVLFFLRVIGVVMGALLSRSVLAETELAVNVADFLTTPAWVIGGILLWRQKEFGYVTGLGLLFQASMLFIALICFLFLQPVFSKVPFALTDIMVVFVMGLTCFVPFVLFVRGVMAKHSTLL